MVAVADLGSAVVLIFWRRRGQVRVNGEPLSRDLYKSVWQRESHTLLHHVGDWSGAVVSVAAGDTIVIPSLSQRTWRVTEDGILPGWGQPEGWEYDIIPDFACR